MEARLNSPPAYHMHIYRSLLYIKFKYDLAARLAMFFRFTQSLDPDFIHSVPILKNERSAFVTGPDETPSSACNTSV
jgi:hypothetical protein